MGDKNNWLKEHLDRIEGKLDKMEAVQSEANTSISLNYQALKEHKTGKCDAMVKHEDSEHKGLVGKILGYLVAIISILGAIITGVWYLATHIGGQK